MNTILENIIEKRKGMYVHALEVNSLEELTDIIETLTDEFNKDGFSFEDIKQFFDTMSIYYLGDDDKEESIIYNFDIESYLTDLF